MLQEAVLNVFSVDLPSAKPFEPNILRWDISMTMTVIPGVHPVARHLPHGQASGGERHLNFRETRDNLLLIGQPRSDQSHSRDRSRTEVASRGDEEFRRRCLVADVTSAKAVAAEPPL